LASTDNFDFFNIKPIQKLIEFNFPLVREYTIRKLLIPYVLFQMVFVFYFNGLLEPFMDMREYQDITRTEDSYLISESFIDQLTTVYRMPETIIA